jgi:MoxR-like ATPase
MNPNHNIPHFLKQSLPNLYAPLSPSQAHHALMELRRQVLKDASGKDVIIGQDDLLDRLLAAMLVRGHCLLEGPPGVNKTRLAMMLAVRMGLIFNRVQCTPDLVPSDLVWITTIVKDPKTGQLAPDERAGKLFSNIVVMDEINRASPKTHSAALEAMSEMQASPPTGKTMRLRPRDPYVEADLLRQVTRPYFGLPQLDPDGDEGQCFVVLATQNPLEHEGVYPLARAQEDRFLFKCLVPHPSLESFAEVSRHAFEIDGNVPISAKRSESEEKEEHVLTLYFLEAVRRQLLGPGAHARWREDQVLRPKVERLTYLTHLSRGNQGLADELGIWRDSDDPKLKQLGDELARIGEGEEYPDVQSGSGIRGYFALIRGAFALALLNPRAATCEDWSELMPTGEDVAKVAFEALRHRIHLAPGARASGSSADQIIDSLMHKLEINT